MSDDEKAVNPSEPEAQSGNANPPNDAGANGTPQSDEEMFLAALNGDITIGTEDEYMFAPIKRGQTIKGTVAGKSET